MESTSQTRLTARQQREFDYHRERAIENRRILDAPFSWDVLHQPGARWWNAYWSMYAYLVKSDMRGKRVLIVGCGFGDDALRIAKLGASVAAFDLSPDSLEIARALAKREQLDIDFAEMPAEAMQYEDSTFDFILARDIMHHVDIPLTMGEIVRVAKPGAVFLVNEIYTHSRMDKVRRSAFVARFLYPRMQRLIYGPGKPYITEDERKLTEADLQHILKPLDAPQLEKHFNFIVTRIVPDRFEFLNKVDRILLIALKPLGRFLAGRVMFSARIPK